MGQVQGTRQAEKSQRALQRGKRRSKSSQGQAALHSRTFCFLILSLCYRGSVLAWPFYSQCMFSLVERRPLKILSGPPPKKSSHTHSSSPYCCPSGPPAACRAISNSVLASTLNLSTSAVAGILSHPHNDT